VIAVVVVVVVVVFDFDGTCRFARAGAGEPRRYCGDVALLLFEWLWWLLVLAWFVDVQVVCCCCYCACDKNKDALEFKFC